ncbi:TetR/AcrR family transcriptional regulator [Streptomyces sp. TS71-3]|uniref:TetR/AcrR family transcriptional regulator n=1 Tax=Streptomyces sp. TS71-3 TaxID=2733862 RepID=UPI001B08CB4B|nr:TetR/AcrR family transcriptional regulator [Streptomyces sp. TS71-3]GHJ41895.1 TetR family transcriptional regulator [Streptomyces sp. TS71-3]
MDDGESRPRRLSRSETKARTRSLLLEAAARVFARKGYAAASVDEIAGSAGFSTGALYSNFAGKKDLFFELLSSRNSEQLAEAAAIASDRADGLEESRRRLSEFLLDLTDADKDMVPLQVEFWLHAIAHPEFRERFVAQFHSHRDTLAQVLTRRAEDRDQSADAPYDQAATVVLALFRGLTQLRRVEPDLVPDDLYGTALHWLFLGLTTSSAPECRPQD